MSDVGTGPPYPLPPLPGGVGTSFTIGLSPIGTQGFRTWDTILSQFANSPRICAIINNFAGAEDQIEDFDAFYDKIWNVLTAEDYGLDVWGRIVDVSRILEVPSGDYFGFEEASPGSEPFNQGTFYSGQPASSAYRLTDDAYRILILAKAAANICGGTIPEINQLLLNLFPGRGNCYVQEAQGSDDRFFGFQEAGTINEEGFNSAPFYSGQSFGHMAIEYVFEFALTPVELAIVTNSGVLPTPCGVSASIVIN